jgi:excinuclease ABC subunit A
VIEHNLDVIKRADYVIDLGPEGGSEGGKIVATGTPEKIADSPQSFTGQYLKPMLERDRARQSKGLSRSAASVKNVSTKMKKKKSAEKL